MRKLNVMEDLTITIKNAITFMPTHQTCRQNEKACQYRIISDQFIINQ